ncbi:hypothetical protein PILCRDRAFT_504850 [Piloderma croceum F 1598]|uniref:Uncharacterized protein n=1 Tax=Piloderma croceum (strain F 1598) TaxID=765440 RepID=A0A0C3BV63_PILCF|nr:hypothetical protein PILCRDRAFT_504850 [Piloderma croceum F 1598]
MQERTSNARSFSTSLPSLNILTSLSIRKTTPSGLRKALVLWTISVNIRPLLGAYLLPQSNEVLHPHLLRLFRSSYQPSET